MKTMWRQLVIGSDHAGYALKEAVKSVQREMGISALDVGTFNADSVDYPDYACFVAEKVSSGEYEAGILLCGSGVGMSIVANKFPGVRAALCLDEYTAEMSRRHNDANILILAGRQTEAVAMEKIVRTWLVTEFDGGRHGRRLGKIREIEAKQMRGTRTCQN
jgi:ribose 5-phosphate isomerase B